MKKFKIIMVVLLLFLSISIQKQSVFTVEAVSGERTLKNFLTTAIEPVGQTMYTWGGGWNAEDTGAGLGATTIGLRPEWREFYLKQTPDYKFSEEVSEKTGGFIDIDNGLDCSGFVGWTIYNVLETESGKEGYVMLANEMASEFSNRGWGKFVKAQDVKKHNPGDIMSSKTHVYICLGDCEDGSLVLVHSSPCGVQITGTTTKDGSKDSLAIKLAEKYMKTYYADWYEKYPECWRGAGYLTNFDQMKWYVNGEDGSILSDPDNIKDMSAEEVLEFLFNE